MTDGVYLRSAPRLPCPPLIAVKNQLRPETMREVKSFILEIKVMLSRRIVYSQIFLAILRSERIGSTSCSPTERQAEMMSEEKMWRVRWSGVRRVRGDGRSREER